MWRNLVFSRFCGYRDSDYYVPEPHKNVDRNGSIYSQDSGQKKEKTAENREILEICNEVPYFITFLKKTEDMKSMPGMLIIIPGRSCRYGNYII